MKLQNKYGNKMTKTNETPLKPCPCCPHSMVSSLQDPYEKWFVGCGACGMTTGHYDREDGAIKAWNTRHAPVIEPKFLFTAPEPTYSTSMTYMAATDGNHAVYDACGKMICEKYLKAGESMSADGVITETPDNEPNPDLFNAIHRIIEGALEKTAYGEPQDAGTIVGRILEEVQKDVTDIEVVETMEDIDNQGINTVEITPKKVKQLLSKDISLLELCAMPAICRAYLAKCEEVKEAYQLHNRQMELSKKFEDEGIHLQTIVEKQRDQINWMSKWVERGIFDKHHTPMGALLCIAHAPDMPWQNDRWNVDHKEYADEFYKTFPTALTEKDE